MHSGNQKLQCVVCHQTIHQNQLLISFIQKVNVCVDCLSTLKQINQVVKIENITVYILYEYNDAFRSLLYRYKANYDLELKHVFLTSHLIELKSMYRKYVVIPAPSSSLSNQKRGFKPMLEIAKELGLKVIDCLYKIDEYKQSDQKYNNRKEVKDHIQILDFDLSKYAVLFIDDVATSNHTLLTCISLIQSKHPKKVEALLLSKRIRKEEEYVRKS